MMIAKNSNDDSQAGGINTWKRVYIPASVERKKEQQALWLGEYMSVQKSASIQFQLMDTDVCLWA